MLAFIHLNETDTVQISLIKVMVMLTYLTPFLFQARAELIQPVRIIVTVSLTHNVIKTVTFLRDICTGSVSFK